MAPRLALLALLALAACGRGPTGDWRQAYGRPTPNPVVIQPAPPLVIPRVLELVTPR